MVSCVANSNSLSRRMAMCLCFYNTMLASTVHAGSVQHYALPLPCRLRAWTAALGWSTTGLRTLHSGLFWQEFISLAILHTINLADDKPETAGIAATPFAKHNYHPISAKAQRKQRCAGEVLLSDLIEPYICPRPQGAPPRLQDNFHRTSSIPTHTPQHHNTTTLYHAISLNTKDLTSQHADCGPPAGLLSSRPNVKSASSTRR